MVFLRGELGPPSAEEIEGIVARVRRSEAVSEEKADVMREQLSAGVVDVHQYLVQR